MTEMILGLIPGYGLMVVFVVVTLACLALPLPAAMLVLAAGSFAATGDLSLWQVVTVTILAFIFGDQAAFRLARWIGPSLLDRMRTRPRLSALIDRSQRLLEQRGKSAILMSHTILSPTCPYVSYLCGAGGMTWTAFSLTAVPSAIIWSLAYVSLGYVFASQLTQVAQIVSHFLYIILAGTTSIACLFWLRSRWQQVPDADLDREELQARS